VKHDFYDLICSGLTLTAQEIAKTTEGVSILARWRSVLEEKRKANESCFPDHEFPAIAQWRSRTSLEKELRTWGLMLERDTASIHSGGYAAIRTVRELAESDRISTKILNLLLIRNPSVILPFYARAVREKINLLLMPPLTSENFGSIDCNALERICDVQTAYYSAINDQLRPGELTFAEQKAMNDRAAIIVAMKEQFAAIKNQQRLNATLSRVSDSMQILSAQTAARKEKQDKKKCVIL